MIKSLIQIFAGVLGVAFGLAVFVLAIKRLPVVANSLGRAAISFAGGGEIGIGPLLFVASGAAGAVIGVLSSGLVVDRLLNRSEGRRD